MNPDSRNPVAGPSYSLSIDRRDRLSHQEFYQSYVLVNRPVVIVDALKDWKALTRWTLDFFRTRYADRSVSVDGRAYPMPEFVDRVKSSSAERPAPYLRNQEVRKLFPDLMEDLKPLPIYFYPNWLGGPLFPSLGSQLEIYIGGAGGSFPYLHYDGNYYFAFICQILGRKEFILFGPDQTPWMYPQAGHHRGHSEVNSAIRPDLEKYPLFARATGMKFEVGPGEMLFIPGGWWHTARMLSASISISMNSACAANWGQVTADICYKAARKNRLLAAALRLYLGLVGVGKSLLDHLLPAL
jgi:histone arginine demethylase JMJD6